MMKAARGVLTGSVLSRRCGRSHTKSYIN
jgi:hypothetical protein